MPAPQCRYWLLTIPVNDWTVPDEWDPLVQYCKGQQEIGEGGYHHWQILLALKSKQRLLKTKSLFCNSAHLEPSRSEAADEYVWKDETAVEGTRFEYGERPFRRNKATDWKIVRTNAESGNLKEIPDDIYIRHYASLTRIAKDHARPGLRKGVECTVLYGPTGTGKSHRAFQEAGETAYIKNPNVKWWDGYRGEENVIIDEFAGLIEITYMLRWIDKYPCMVENKGGALPLSATKFWITSNKHPSEWYPNATDAHRAALSRRLTSITLMNAPYIPPPVLAEINWELELD